MHPSCIPRAAAVTQGTRLGRALLAPRASGKAQLSPTSKATKRCLGAVSITLSSLRNTVCGAKLISRTKFWTVMLFLSSQLDTDMINELSYGLDSGTVQLEEHTPSVIKPAAPCELALRCLRLRAQKLPMIWSRLFCGPLICFG